MSYFDSTFSQMNSNDIEAELTPGLWWITPRVEIMNLVKGVALKIILFCQQFFQIRQQFSLFVTISYQKSWANEPPWTTLVRV